MIRRTFSRIVLTLGLLQGTLALPGCSGSPASDSEATQAGTLSMPLLASAGAHTYRLQGSMYVVGPIFTYLDLNADSNVAATTLPAGEYYANLYSWTLQRDDGTGSFVPVSASLVSSSNPSFSIFNQTTTSISFQFDTDGQIVTVGAGQLNVAIDVTETPPVCSPLGSDCTEGSWCAPSELTGAPLACIPAGPVALGEACSSPVDCAANTSCFELGAGPVCASLCAMTEFDQPCSSGGTCAPQGVDYGVCVP